MRRLLYQEVRREFGARFFRDSTDAEAGVAPMGELQEQFQKERLDKDAAEKAKDDERRERNARLMRGEGVE